VKCNFTQKTAVCVFEPPFEQLRGNVHVHLRLNGKRVVDFLLVLIGLFHHVLWLGPISTENQRFRSNSLVQNFR